MTTTFEIQNFKKIDRRKQKLLNCKHWRGQMKFLNNAGYQSTVGSLLNTKSHKTKIEFFEFSSVSFLKFCTYQDITFVNVNTDFHKIKSKDFFCTLLENVSIFHHRGGF